MKLEPGVTPSPPLHTGQRAGGGHECSRQVTGQCPHSEQTSTINNGKRAGRVGKHGFVSSKSSSINIKSMSPSTVGTFVQQYIENRKKILRCRLLPMRDSEKGTFPLFFHGRATDNLRGGGSVICRLGYDCIRSKPQPSHTCAGRLLMCVCCSHIEEDRRNQEAEKYQRSWTVPTGRHGKIHEL